MKFLLKLFLYIATFFIALLIFLPKIGLYNLVEEKLNKKNIVISDESRKEKAFSLALENMNIYYDGIDTALIKNAKFTSYIFHTNIEINAIRVSNSFKNMIPNKIKNINIKHSVMNFEKVYISSNGEFGEFIGEYLIFENKITGELKPSKIMKSKYRNILRQFKLKDGKYYYEYQL